MRKHERMKKKQFMEYDYTMVICIGVGILIGTSYAILLRDQYALYYTIQQLILDQSDISAFQVIQNSFITYFIQLGLVMLGLSFRWGKYIACAVSVGVAFGYGFSIGSMLLLYGFKGIALGVGLLGIPAVIILGSMVFLYACREGLVKFDRARLGGLIGMVTVICIGISVFNGYIQPLIEKLLFYMI